MKALVFDRYAADDDFESILRIDDIPEPEPLPGHVVFRVRSAALNHDDIWAMRGRPITVPMPHISGTDAAGDVIAVGEGVSGISVGDRIVSHANLSCRVCGMCTSGREYDCRRRRVWGFQTGPLWGGFCEVTHLPESNVVRISDDTSYDTAAAASMTAMTSWHMLAGRARVQPGQTVLVMGGASGMGTFGIQIAKLLGCTVIATAGPDKLHRCVELGADHAVDHRSSDWHLQVKEISDRIAASAGRPAGLDVIYEHIGGAHWQKELLLLRRGGTIVTTGATTGYDVRTDLHHLIREGISILGSTQGTRAELERVFYWISRGRLRPVIDSSYDLADAPAAHRKMLYGNVVGKILLHP